MKLMRRRKESNIHLLEPKLFKKILIYTIIMRMMLEKIYVSGKLKIELASYIDAR